MIGLHLSTTDSRNKAGILLGKNCSRCAAAVVATAQQLNLNAQRTALHVTKCCCAAPHTIMLLLLLRCRWLLRTSCCCRVCPSRCC